MKKVLILAYYFPPCNMPGANRPLGWAKYLNKFGYYPIIITRRWDNEIRNPVDILRKTPGEILHEVSNEYEVFYLPYKQNFRDNIFVKYGEKEFVLFRKFLTFLELFFQNFTNLLIPYRNIYSYADKYLSGHKDVKIIIATGAPFILFKFAYRLNKKHSIPWLADYRDDWNTSGFSLVLRKTNRILKIIEQKSELKWLSSAIFHTAVSPYSVIKNNHFLKKQGFPIHNGYFFEDRKNYDSNNLFDVFTISFIGTLYPTQNIDVFLDGFITFINKYNNNVNIIILFPGLAYDIEQKQRITNYLKGYERYFKITERIPKNEIVEIENRTPAFLYCAHNVPGVIGSKIYEYIGLKKPVIFCPSDNGVIEAIFKETGIGLICNEKYSACDAIEKLYLDHSNSRPFNSSYFNEEKVYFYSRLSQTKLLAEVFDHALTEINSSSHRFKREKTGCEFFCPVANTETISFFNSLEADKSSSELNHSKNRKKLLILAYDFPPYISVGGLRPYSWYKYLNEFDIYPVVVTRQWSYIYGNRLDYVSKSANVETEIEVTPFGTIVKAPYKPNLSNKLLIKYGENRFFIIRKIISAYFELGQYLFHIGPKSTLFFSAKEYLRTNCVDAIIATGEPYVLFGYASVLSDKYKIPWIADYRDPWTQNKVRSKNRITKNWNAFFERRYLQNVHAVITVSSFCESQISKLVLNKTFYIIPNGYDPDAIEKAKEITQNNKKLSIAFVGTIYKWFPVESFLNVCNEFIQDIKSKDFQVNFYGINYEIEIEELIRSKFKDLAPFVSFYPQIPNELLLQKLAAENLFLLFDTYFYAGTKIYDYLALKRKILLCYSHDDEAIRLKEKYYNLDVPESEYLHLQKEILNETNSGILVKDASHLKKLLKEFYNEFQSKGFIDCNSVNTEQFSRKPQTQKLSEIIHGFFKKKEFIYQQCSRCVMDTSDTNITFDSKGHCKHCNDYFENTSKLTYSGVISDKKLQALVSKIKRSGKNNKYDCIVGISGGVDSIYTAYLTVKLGLRPLAVHMDNGWDSELAVSNIEKALNILNIDLYTYVINWDEFKDIQLAFFKASVPEIETPTDIAILATLHKVAKLHKVQYIFSGGNFATEGILPKNWHYNSKDVKYLKAIYYRFGTKKLDSFPIFGFQLEMFYKIIKGIKMIYPLNYIPYNKQNAIKILEDELDWKNYGGKHHESIYTRFVQSYILPEKFGIDYRKATYSSQICAGELSRDNAILKLYNKPFDEETIDADIEYFCKKLEISVSEFNEIMNMPKKSYIDYPNDKKNLEFIYKIYRKINQ